MVQSLAPSSISTFLAYSSNSATWKQNTAATIRPLTTTKLRRGDPDARPGCIVSNKSNFWYRFRYGIALRIVAPFLLLTLFVALVGTFVITTMMTRTVEERYANQLLDAGRVVAGRMVDLEQSRLESVRLLAGTEPIAAGVATGETAVLQDYIRSIIINYRLDAVEILDRNGNELFGWEREPGLPLETITPRSGNNLAHIEEVQRVLSGYEDGFGNRRVAISQTEGGAYVMYTIGPIFWGGEQVGAVMVGSYLDTVIEDLSEYALARVTLYDANGIVRATSLVPSNSALFVADEERARQEQILATIQESAEQYQRVSSRAEEEVPFSSVTVMDQIYRLAYGDWRLRGQSFGMYSVAMPLDYVDSPLTTGRDTFIFFFMLTFLGILLIGLIVTRSITKPLSQLVEVATAVGEGQLDQRSGIERRDEIGQLAASFDQMTIRLESRNQALLKQTSELETILNSITDGVILLDTDHQIVLANVAAQKLLADLSHDFLTAGPLRELTSGVGGDGSNGRSGQTAVVLHPRRHQIGNRVLTSLSTEVTNPDGNPYGTVIVMRDVTQEVEAEQLKDAFITSISHELRTPLTVIKVYADLLLKTGNGQLSERQQQFMQNIQKGSQQLEQHINQLLHISEIQAGTIRLMRERRMMHELVRGALGNWQKRFESKGVALCPSFPDEPVWVLVDATHMGWAIESLLSNAHNYTAVGGRVDIHLERNDHEVRLTVTDNGIGIAAADQPYLFDRFFRAQNSINYEMRGVGLGLFIARSVVEMHGGQLAVSSELGQGSSFTITLPVEAS